jgi:transaldolase/glucose-6-phosphate isomerase
LGKIAIANAKAAYARFRETFNGARWERLVAQGARVQRPLWASTSTKNALYSDTMYVDALIGPDTVNTVPPATLTTFRERGTVAPTLEADMDLVQAQLSQLAGLGVDLDTITQRVQDEGVAAFAKSFESLLKSVDEKRTLLLSEWQRRTASLGECQAGVDAALDKMVEDNVIARIWAHDHTVWKPEPDEISNRLGWLHIAEMMVEEVPCLTAFAEDVVADGYTDVLLLGMGGSSLAPEVFSNAFIGQAARMPRLTVLDSTVPGAVLAQAERLDPARTLFIVATKSGGTAETL